MIATDSLYLILDANTKTPHILIVPATPVIHGQRDQKHTRQEFIDSMPSLKITRFDASVLTVEPRGNDWSVLIFEKVEVETKDKDGKTSKGYRVLVARDGWRKLNDNQWILLSSEPLGQQRWKDEIPPIANW